MIRGRTLSRDEISDIWTIDRSEVIEALYELEPDDIHLEYAFE